MMMGATDVLKFVGNLLKCGTSFHLVLGSCSNCLLR